MLKLIKTDWASFDLAFDDPAQGDAAAAATTLVYGVLYTDSEAPAGRVADAFDRRGYWADPAAGTGLWHVRRQPLNSAARREALAMINTALTTRAPALSAVAVQEVKLIDRAGNVSSLVVEVSGLHNGHKFIVRAPL